MDGVSHFEVPVDDMARAVRFYAKVFGWTVEAVPGAGADYHLVTTVPSDEHGQPTVPGRINGALFKKGTHGQEHIAIVVNVPSIDKCEKKIAAAGGKVLLPKTPVGDFGFYAQVTDTEGNVIGIWEDAR
jgi:predicted enzyme related to lactoylglutathione lyase